MPDRPFLSRVRRILPDLHPAEQKLGRLVCDFPGELASYSASELADLAGVSNATVSRFVRRLGYDNYEEARLYLGDVKVAAPHDPRIYAETDMRNVENTLASVTSEEIDRLVAELLSARKVWMFGFRVGASLAQYLQWQLLQVIEECVALPGPGQTMGEHLAGLQPDDVVILFGIRRRVAQMSSILVGVERAKCKLAYITDESEPLQPSADWHFRCITASSGPLFSHVGVMALMNLIANRAIDAAEDRGRDRLASIEAANDLLGEL